MPYLELGENKVSSLIAGGHNARDQYQNICHGMDSSINHCLEGLKPVLLRRNLTLNSDAAPRYKYMYGPHRGPLLYKRNLIVHGA